MNEYITLLRRNRNFRNLWLGTVVSLLGDWFNLLASADLIAQLTNSSGLAVSTLFLARFLPIFVFSPVAGVLADRFDRRRIMILTDFCRAAIVLCFLLIQSAEQIWVFYLLTALQFTLSALFTPAKSAVLPTIVERKDLVTANALDSFTWSTMLAFGSFLGGIVAAYFGGEIAFILDALTFLVSAWFISRIIMPERTVRIAGRVGGWVDFLEGLRYLRHEPFILVIALVKAGGALVWGAINVLEIVFAEEIFNLGDNTITQALRLTDPGSAALGIIYVFTGLGTGFGPIIMRRLLGDRRRQLLKGITIGFLFLPTGIFILSQAPSFPIFLAGTLVRTTGSGVIWVFSAVFLQKIVPDQYRGRVFAFEFAALTLTQSISILGAGYLLDTAGLDVRMVTMVSAMTGVTVSLLWMVFYLATLKRPLQVENA